MQGSSGKGNHNICLIEQYRASPVQANSVDLVEPLGTIVQVVWKTKPKAVCSGIAHTSSRVYLLLIFHRLHQGASVAQTLLEKK